VAGFFGTPLEEQLEFQRGDAPGWSTGARDALAAVRLLPPNMDTFKLTHEQNTELKRKQAEGLERKTSNVCVVATSIDLLLDEAKAVLDSADKADKANKADMLTLITAVMVVTGRRTAEITNGHSTFEEVPGQDHRARFHGAGQDARQTQAVYHPDTRPVRDTRQGVRGHAAHATERKAVKRQSQGRVPVDPLEGVVQAARPPESA